MPFCASHPILSLDKVLDFFPKTCIKNQNPSELHNLSESPLFGNYKGMEVEKTI
jgi:hypothetical protein